MRTAESRLVDDGIITGRVMTTPQWCDVCGAKGIVGIRVYRVTMPRGLEVRCTILWEDSRLIYFVGVSCGCYGRFHRQVAHIQDKREARLSAQ